MGYSKLQLVLNLFIRRSMLGMRYERIRSPSGLAVYFQDVTEEKAARAIFIKQAQTVQQQLAEIEAIYASAPIGLCFLDTELRFVRLNDRLAEINGVPASAHIGKTWREILPEMADDLEPLSRQVIQTKVPLPQFEVCRTNSTQPGLEQDWLLSLYPLRPRRSRFGRECDGA